MPLTALAGPVGTLAAIGLLPTAEPWPLLGVGRTGLDPGGR